MVENAVKQFSFFLTCSAVTVYSVCMQAYSLSTENCPYTLGMKTGRPPKSQDRSEIGKRLFDARQNAGLSQTQVSEQIGVPQQTYAGWERKKCAIDPECLAKLAEIFNVSVDYLVGASNKPQRRGGPRGKALRLFEELGNLPRSKQNRILGVVEDLIAAQRQ